MLFLDVASSFLCWQPPSLLWGRSREVSAVADSARPAPFQPVANRRFLPEHLPYGRVSASPHAHCRLACLLQHLPSVAQGTLACIAEHTRNLPNAFFTFYRYHLNRRASFPLQLLDKPVALGSAGNLG